MKFYNKLTNKYNSLRVARRNGITKNPDNFVFPDDIAYNKKTNRFISYKTALKSINDKTVNIIDIVIQGYIYNPFTKRFNKNTQQNINKIEKLVKQAEETKKKVEAINKIKAYLKKIIQKKKEETKRRLFQNVITLKTGFQEPFYDLHQQNIKKMVKSNPNSIYKHIIKFYGDDGKLAEVITFNFDKYDDKIKEDIKFKLKASGGDWRLNEWLNNYDDITFEDEDVIFTPNNKKIEVIYEAFKKVDTSMINDNDKDTQEYKANETSDCVYMAMLEYFANKKSRDGQMIYNRLLKKAYKYKKPYTDKNINSIAQICNSSVVIHDLVNGNHKVFNENTMNKFRVEFINTRYNHLELKLSNSDDKVEKVDRLKYTEIKQNSQYYVEKNGKLHTINKIKDGHEKIDEDYEIQKYKTEYKIYTSEDDIYNNVVNKWKAENDFNALSMPINNKHYDFLMGYDYSVFRFMNDIKVNNNEYKELDLKSAYFRAVDKKYNQFYIGVPSGGFISFENDGTFDYNKLDNELVGFFEVKIISNNNDDIHKLFKYGSKHILYSATLNYIINKGVKVYIERGIYSPSIDMKFNDDFLKECGYKVKIYCKFFGCLMLENKYTTIEIKPDILDEKYLSVINNKDYEIYQDDNKIIMRKEIENPFTYRHIAYAIHSYTKLKILDQILNIGLNNVEGVKLDSIVVKNNFNFIETEEWKIKTAKIEEMFQNHTVINNIVVMTDSFTTDFYESKQSDIKFSKTFLSTGEYLYKRVLFLGGAGGCGKTYSILNNDNIIDFKRLVFSSFCWNLIQSVSGKYKNIIPASTPKITGEMNDIEVDTITRIYNFILADEATLTDAQQYIKMINDKKHCFIFICGDIEDDGFAFQCRAQNKVIKPSSINCQYVKYTKTYRFSDELNEKIMKIRKIMKNLHNNKMLSDITRTRILFDYIKNMFNDKFYNKEDIIYKDNYIGISCLNDNGEKSRHHTEYFINKDKVKPRYYIKNTVLKAGQLAGRQVEEPTKNTYSTLFKTIHSFQGLELNHDQKIIILIDNLFDFNLLYTAISRARNSDQLIFIDDRK